MRQRGFLLLEVLLSALMMGMIVSWMVRLEVVSARTRHDQLIGKHLSLMASALSHYLALYRTQLITGQPILLPSGGTVHDTHAPTRQELQALDCLSGHWTDWNGLDHQGWLFRIVQDSAHCTVLSCRLLGLVSLPNPIMDPHRMTDVVRIQHVMQGVQGHLAVYVDPFYPADMRSANGAVRFSNMLGRVGMVGVLVGAWHEEIYLRRSGALPMTGDLNMGGHDMHAVQAIHAVGKLSFFAPSGEAVFDHTEVQAIDFVPGVHAVNDNCHAEGALSRSSDYDVLMCMHGFWQTTDHHLSGLRALFIPFRGHQFFCQDPRTAAVVDVLIDQTGMPSLRVRGYTDWTVGVSASALTPGGYVSFALTPSGVHVNGSGVPTCYFPLSLS